MTVASNICDYMSAFYMLLFFVIWAIIKLLAHLFQQHKTKQRLIATASRQNYNYSCNFSFMVRFRVNKRILMTCLFPKVNLFCCNSYKHEIMKISLSRFRSIFPFHALLKTEKHLIQVTWKGKIGLKQINHRKQFSIVLLLSSRLYTGINHVLCLTVRYACLPNYI